MNEVLRKLVNGANEIVRGNFSSVTISSLVFTTVTCGGRLPESPTPVLNTDQVVSRAESGNPFSSPTQVVFEWSIREPNLRLNGMGVARLEPPAKARLDLFLENGQSVLAAALVDDKLHVPKGTPLRVVPSPPLLWASLGMFRPGPRAVLLGAEELEDNRIRLRYHLPSGDELRYEMEDGHLTGVELRDRGSAVHRVALERKEQGQLPHEVTYRNLASFRELKITVTTVEKVDFYPSDIWYPGL